MTSNMSTFLLFSWNVLVIIVCILYLIYCNYYHIYPITFFLHISPSLFCHGTAFISYSLRAHLYHLTVFFSLPSANMALLSFSFPPSLSLAFLCFSNCTRYHFLIMYIIGLFYNIVVNILRFLYLAVSHNITYHL